MSNFVVDHGLVNWADGPSVIVAAGRDDSMRQSEPHSHARGQLFASMRGLLTIGVADAVWVVPSVHAVWLPPHHVHSARSHGPFEGWGAYVAESSCADLPSSACTIRISNLLREAVMRAASWPLERHRALTPAQERIAGVIMDEIRDLPPEPLGLPMPQDARLQRIASALVDDPASKRDLDAWATWGGAQQPYAEPAFRHGDGFYVHCLAPARTADARARDAGGRRAGGNGRARPGLFHGQRFHCRVPGSVRVYAKRLPASLAGMGRCELTV